MRFKTDVEWCYFVVGLEKKATDTTKAPYATVENAHESKLISRFLKDLLPSWLEKCHVKIICYKLWAFENFVHAPNWFKRSPGEHVQGVCTKRGADERISEKLDLTIGPTNEVSPAQIAQLVAKSGGYVGNGSLVAKKHEVIRIYRVRLKTVPSEPNYCEFHRPRKKKCFFCFSFFF